MRTMNVSINCKTLLLSSMLLLATQSNASQMDKDSVAICDDNTLVNNEKVVENKIKTFGFGFDYTTELQTDFSKVSYNNQLHLDFTARISKHLSFNLRSLTLLNTREESIIDDWQYFSNLIERNVYFSLVHANLQWDINDKNTLYFGIHNFNDDYFASDVTSLFTNSSCGIYPTISFNGSSANFPYSSVGIHYRYQDEKWRYLASVYNGNGYNKFSGAENVFRFCPADDGVFAMTQVDYTHKGSTYFLGASAHFGPLPYLEGSKVRPALWGYCEQRLSPNLYLLAGYSHAFGGDVPCSDFAGVGAKVTIGKAEIGLFTDYAKFYTGILDPFVDELLGEEASDELSGMLGKSEEFATELTCKYSFNDHFYVQPSVHFVHNDESRVAGLVRFGVEF